MCVSNLPYNVATPVVVRLLEEAPTVERLVVMVQREVGERLVAAARHADLRGGVGEGRVPRRRPGSSARVPATVFVPRPKVESVLVRLDRRAAPPVDVPSHDELFTHRPRRLRAAAQDAAQGAACRCSATGPKRCSPPRASTPTARAESLDLDAWASIARAAA